MIVRGRMISAPTISIPPRCVTVGANCVRPRARKPRPYKSYARLVRNGRGAFVRGRGNRAPKRREQAPPYSFPPTSQHPTKSLPLEGKPLPYPTSRRHRRGELRSPAGAETSPRNGGSKPPPYKLYPRSVRDCGFFYLVKTSLYHPWVERLFFILKNAPKRRFYGGGRPNTRKTKKICRNRLKTIEKISYICYNDYIWGNRPFRKILLLFAVVFPIDLRCPALP